MQIHCIDQYELYGIKILIMENRKITVFLSCATCGGADFDFNEDKSFVKCKTCNREYTGGYDELVKNNQAQINQAIHETKKVIVEDFRKSLKDILKGNKQIKFR